MAVFVIEIMIIIAMIGVLYYVMKHTENEYDKAHIRVEDGDVYLFVHLTA